MGTQPPNNQPLCFYGGTEMTSQDNLRDRIAEVIHERTAFFGGHAYPETLAQAIIDEFGVTVRGDGCGYHEIYGSYDTRFGK